MKVVVTGSNGFVGKALVRKLSRSDRFTIATIERTPNNPPDSSGYVSEKMFCDFTDENAIRALDLVGSEVVIHAAGRAHILNDVASNPLEEYRKINTLGTLELAKRALRCGAREFIFLSSIKVNGEATVYGRPFTEASLARPVDDYAQSKHEAELGLLKIAQTSSLAVTIIRPPLIYGPGALGNFGRIVRLVRSGIPLPFASADLNLRSFIGIDNLVSFIEACLSVPAVKHRTLLVSDNHDLSTKALIDLIAMSEGRKSKLFKVPISVLRSVFEAFGMRPMAEKLFGSLQVDPKESMELLQWEPPLSVALGFERLAKNHSDQG